MVATLGRFACPARRPAGASFARSVGRRRRAQHHPCDVVAGMMTPVAHSRDNPPVRDRLAATAKILWRPTGLPPMPSARNLAFDVGLALAAAIAMIWYGLVGPTEQDVVFVGGPAAAARPLSDDLTVSIGLAVIASVALALRRRYPLAVLTAVLAATVAAPVDAPRLTIVACVIAAYSAAAYSPYRVPTLAGGLLAVVLFSLTVDVAIPIVPAKYFPLLVLAPVIVAADGLRRWKLQADERSARLAELERDRTEAIRRAAQEERARIARE